MPFRKKCRKRKSRCSVCRKGPLTNGYYWVYGHMFKERVCSRCSHRFFGNARKVNRQKISRIPLKTKVLSQYLLIN